MPDHDSPPIELRLRGYAEQRRAQAGGPFVPPPLVRRAVRAEVDRRWGHAAQRTARLRRWNLIWPRLGWTAGITAALALVAMLVLDFGWPVKWQTAAKRSSSDAASDRGAISQSPAPPQALGLRSDWSGHMPAMTPGPTLPPLGRENESNVDSPPGPAAAASPTRAAAPAPVTAASTRASSISDAASASRGGGAGAVGSAVRTPAPAAAELARHGGQVAAAGRVRAAPEPATATNQQRFIQTRARGLRQNVNSPPPSPVLQEFEVAQIGRRLRFTEPDGSTYFAEVTAPPLATPTGTVATPTRAEGFRSQPARAPAAAVRPTPADHTLFFNAVGTNRTLSQRVVFDGRLVFTNAQMPPPSVEVVLTNDAAFGIWLDNSRIEGEAVIGERTRIQVEALPESFE